jgi:serine protease Do
MPSSPAARKGLRAGDIILKVGNATVTSPEDVIEEVKKMKSNEKPVLLLVQRKNNQRYVALKTA